MKDNLQHEFEFRASADRHGIGHGDASHAFRNAISLWDLDDGVQMYVGPGWSGELLEVGVVRVADTVVVIHAMHARARFLRRK